MVLIKCCDISNEVRPMEVSEPWVDCLLEEYFNQVMPLFVYIKNIPDGHQSFLTSTARYYICLLGYLLLNIPLLDFLFILRHHHYW